MSQDDNFLGKLLLFLTNSGGNLPFAEKKCSYNLCLEDKMVHFELTGAYEIVCIIEFVCFASKSVCS